MILRNGRARLGNDTGMVGLSSRSRPPWHRPGTKTKKNVETIENKEKHENHENTENNENVQNLENIEHLEK